MSAPDIEVASARDVPEMVGRHGFAIRRGLFPGALIGAVLAKVSANANTQAAYANYSYGTMDPNVLGPELKAQLLTPDIAATFDAMLEGAAFHVPDAESPIFVSWQAKTPTVWHQDKCVNAKPSALVWIALTPCGVTSPSMKIVLKGLREAHPLLLEEDRRRVAEKEAVIAASGWPVMTLVFNPGDAVFFNSYSVHKTHITPEMEKPRVSVKLTAVPT